MMKRKQFTLLEILITIGVVLILAGITVGGLTMASDKGDEAKTTAIMQEFEMALEKFKADKGVYPMFPQCDTSSNWVKAKAKNAWTGFNTGHYYKPQDVLPVKDKQSDSIAVEKITVEDGYGNQLYYRYPGKHNPKKYDLWSLGSDPDDGSDDICNWRQK